MSALKLRELRADLAFIAHWVPARAHVLDLGCGDGAMLEHLQTTKNCTGYGIEIDDKKIPGCTSRGVAVIQQDLEKGLKLNTECIERILTFDDDKRLAILLKHKVEIDASVIFNWPVFDKIELLKVYLENDGDPNVCDENEQSLIDYWYSVKGDCPAVTLLEEYGAKKSTDAMTLKEKMESISDMLKRAEEDPEFAEKLQAEYDKAMNKKQEKEEENE